MRVVATSVVVEPHPRPAIPRFPTLVYWITFLTFTVTLQDCRGSASKVAGSAVVVARPASASA